MGRFTRRNYEQDLGDELRADIEIETQQNISAGMPPDEFGNVGWRSNSAGTCVATLSKERLSQRVLRHHSPREILRSCSTAQT